MWVRPLSLLRLARVSPSAISPDLSRSYGPSVAVGPRFPIGYKGGQRQGRPPNVAVGPRFPIGYKGRLLCMDVRGVAVGPRFPIGYKTFTIL